MKRSVLLLCTLSLLALCGCGQREIAPSAPAESSVSESPVSYPESPETQGLTIARTEHNRYITEAIEAFNRLSPDTPLESVWYTDNENELKLSLMWTDEWKMSREMLTAAYNACVDSISKFDMKYVSKILENWHEKGYKTPDDIEEKKKSGTKKRSFAAYDLDLFEKMLNSDD